MDNNSNLEAANANSEIIQENTEIIDNQKCLKYVFTEPSDKSYYEEFYYIIANYKRFRKKPTRKPKSVIKMIVARMIRNWIICLVFAGALYLLKSYYFALFFLSYTVIYTAMMAGQIAKYKKAINECITQFTQETMTINEEGISAVEKHKSLSADWDSMKYVIFNRKTIVFLPDDSKSAAFGIPIQYKMEVLNFMQEIGRIDMVVDNTI